MDKHFSVTKSVEFDYGHRVPNHGSKCCNVHGHRGKVEVLVCGMLVPEGVKNSAEGMVMDFSRIKEVLTTEIHDRFDHRFLMAANDPMGARLKKAFRVLEEWMKDDTLGAIWYAEDFGWVHELPCVPTAENLAYHCYQLLTAKLNTETVKVAYVNFWETPTSVARYPGVGYEAVL